MKQERLNALMVLTVEQEMAVNVDADAVIDDFKIAVDFKRYAEQHFWLRLCISHIRSS